MSRTFFKSLSDWKMLEEELQKQRDAHRDEALSVAGPTADLAFAAREYERGWYNALQYVLELPDQILRDSDDDKDKAEEPPEPGETLRVVPERRLSSRY
jgi:hypothetical protein